MWWLLQSDDHAVAVAGGLEEGDLILDVNGQNMEGVTYDRYSFLCCDLFVFLCETLKVYILTNSVNW